jgi:nicotianamine synthase
MTANTERLWSPANEMLLTFPYHSNYTDLVHMELNALASIHPDFVPRSFAILGSGSLSLTSLCICHQLNSSHDNINITCHNVDTNALAISSSTDMCRVLGLAESEMCFQCADADSADVDFRAFDVVYLAAMVGRSSSHKQSTLADMAKRMRARGLVVLRSTHSLKRLLYPVRHHPALFSNSC